MLLSHNNTVQGMVSLAIHPLEDTLLDTFESMEEVVDDHYDWLLVDDTIPMYQESLALAKRLNIQHTVLLYHPENIDNVGFDIYIQKPFLPEEIRQLITENNSQDLQLSGIDNKNKPTNTKNEKRKKMKKNKAKEDTSSTQILNLDEIETIKALLEEDGLEIVAEDELADTVLSEENTKKKKKRQKKKEKDLNNELLKALIQMKPKKIRKLLKGARVKIEITFPKGR